MSSDTPLPPAPAGGRADLVGHVLLGRYRVDELIAEGGMAAVYAGEHLALRRRVAIKLLDPTVSGTTEMAMRFEREAIAGARIMHPNVVAALDFDRLEDGSLFLVLEYVRGVTLHDLIRRGPLPPARALRIARQIAEGLQAAHILGVIHRDVKPRNIMLVEPEAHEAGRDAIKIIDFGLCKVPADLGSSKHAPRDSKRDAALTASGMVFGTAPFMAPETALGMDAVDHRADLYALGMVLYRMLAGVHPWDAGTEVEHILANRHEQPPPIAARAPGTNVPPELEAVVLRLLKKDVRARYESAAAVVDALDEVMRAAKLDAVAESAPPTGALPMSVAGAMASKPDEEELPDARTAHELSKRIELPGPYVPLAQRPRPRRRQALLLAAVTVACVVGGAIAAELALRRASTPAPSAAAPTVPSAGEAPAREVVLAGEGKDAASYKQMLSTAHADKAWDDAAKAVLALVELDPAAFAERPVREATVALLVRLEFVGDARAAQVFAALAERLGSVGPDVLYDLVATRGGTKGAQRAAELLRRPDVAERGTPALRIAVALRDASCKDKPSLFDRAASEGDERALATLDMLRSKDCNPRIGQCCFKRDVAIERAASSLRARLRR